MGSLSQKLGPLPKWAWLLIAAAVGYYVLRRAKSSSPAAGQQVTVAQQTPDTASGLVPSAGAPTDTGAVTSDYLSTLAAENSNLTSALGDAYQTIAQTAQTQLAYNATQTTNGSFDTSGAAVTQPQPGGSNAPTFSFVFPGITTATSTAPTQKTGPAGPKTSTSPATKFYTYKRNVPLKQGQTVHFQAGKGYYAG